MSYKIPNEEIIVYIIKKIMMKQRIIYSQKKFLELVLNELKSTDNVYKLTEKRLRKIAITKAGVKVEMEYRETDMGIDDMKVCPVCGSKLTKIYNKTLDNIEVPIGLKCQTCGYWTGPKKRIPKRYIFLW